MLPPLKFTKTELFFVGTIKIMSIRLIGSLCLIWLFLATAALAQPNPSVIDTKNQPLHPGQRYYIKPAITDSGGRFTLINRNGSCPLFVGQENVSGPAGFPVVFTPFAKGETIIRESKDLIVAFAASTTCVQSTAWKVGETDTKTNRRLIVTGRVEKFGSFFRIVKNSVGFNIYNLQWCPTDLCATCRFRCGSVGNLVENGKRLLALDGNVLPVVFEKA
ncbi:Kunitz type trypsin inhibitor [Quillaja saponaria]|uniref:Kunitz type trypsin inhibitor n=1 Tax=Quillaja saponaria TaxID=32244 RepID=A0AAD7VMV2_QUISA|nr:Kunitz type trypsin inhibitor [Quillaja saponaria]